MLILFFSNPTLEWKKLRKIVGYVKIRSANFLGANNTATALPAVIQRNCVVVYVLSCARRLHSQLDSQAKMHVVTRGLRAIYSLFEKKCTRKSSRVPIVLYILYNIGMYISISLRF